MSVVPQGDAGDDSLPEVTHASTICSGPHVSFLSAWALQGGGVASVLALPHRGKVTAVTVAAVAVAVAAAVAAAVTAAAQEDLQA